MAKKDNKGIIQKVRLRQLVLNEIQNPVVMETNAGFGHIFTECYQGIPVGVAFETDMEKCNALVMQRPSWAVYQNRCEPALEAGCGFHVPVNFVDVDPYGDPWPIIDALLCNASNLPDRWGLAVNDGLKRYLIARCDYYSIYAAAHDVQTALNALEYFNPGFVPTTQQLISAKRFALEAEEIKP